MSDSKKTQYLESVVLKGLCPNCYSSDVLYFEYEKNKIFGFKCRQCGWKSTHTSEEFMTISASWSLIEARQKFF
jgi:Zn ribbon nucleic-acid-binding protein